MNEHSTDASNLKGDDEPSPLSILDLLVVAADNWLLLLLGPLSAGLLAYFILSTQPASYLAYSDFTLNAAMPAPVLRKMLDADLGQNLARNITVHPTSKATVLTVGGITAEEAHAGVVGALKALARYPSLTTERSDFVLGDIRQNRTQVAALQALFDPLKLRIQAALDAELGSQPANFSDAVTAFITISDKLAALNRAGTDLQTLLDSKLIGSPEQSIYVKATQSSSLATSVLSGLLVELGIYVVVLLRHMWNQASKDPRSKLKMQRIRHSLLRRRWPYRAD